MKTKLKITVVSVIEVETNDYKAKTVKGAAKETQKALDDNEISVDELLAFAKSVDIKVEPDE